MAARIAKDGWTPKHEKAAALVADDRLTDVKIADDLRISKRTLENWKKLPAFEKRVREYIIQYCAVVESIGIGSVKKRILEADNRHRALKGVIAARSERYQPLLSTPTTSTQPKIKATAEPETDPKTELEATLTAALSEYLIPGEAAGGYVLCEVTYSKAGKTIKWAVDIPTLDMLLKLEERVARELGQWKERAEVEARDTSALDAVKRKLLSRSRPTGDPAASGGNAGGGS